jgi:hypothetical protein
MVGASGQSNIACVIAGGSSAQAIRVQLVPANNRQRQAGNSRTEWPSSGLIVDHLALHVLMAYTSNHVPTWSDVRHCDDA